MERDGVSAPLAASMCKTRYLDKALKSSGLVSDVQNGQSEPKRTTRVGRVLRNSQDYL